jgi:hypothetical protein
MSRHLDAPAPQHCQAQCEEPPWFLHTHRCSRLATMLDADSGLAVCTQHARMLVKRPRLAEGWKRGSR